MTDAKLMDADCVHGVVWWSCDACSQPTELELAETELEKSQLDLDAATDAYRDALDRVNEARRKESDV